MSVRDRIHETALRVGWEAALGTEVVENVRIYQRGSHTLLVGYTPNGATTGATELIETKDGRERGFDVPYRDKNKAQQILDWLEKGRS